MCTLLLYRLIMVFNFEVLAREGSVVRGKGQWYRTWLLLSSLCLFIHTLSENHKTEKVLGAEPVLRWRFQAFKCVLDGFHLFALSFYPITLSLLFFFLKFEPSKTRLND